MIVVVIVRPLDVLVVVAGALEVEAVSTVGVTLRTTCVVGDGVSAAGAGADVVSTGGAAVLLGALSAVDVTDSSLEVVAGRMVDAEVGVVTLLLRLLLPIVPEGEGAGDEGASEGADDAVGTGEGVMLGFRASWPAVEGMATAARARATAMV